MDFLGPRDGIWSNGRDFEPKTDSPGTMSLPNVSHLLFGRSLTETQLDVARSVLEVGRCEAWQQEGMRRRRR